MSELIRNSIEERLSETIAKFHHEQQGHSPKCSTTLLPTMAVIYSSNVFTSTEQELCQTPEGQKFIQSARREQRALTRKEIERRIGAVLSRVVQRSFYDLDVRTGDQIEVYMLA